MAKTRPPYTPEFRRQADDFDHVDDEHLARLRCQLLRWATDNAEALVKAAPEIPPGLYNRARMNWRPLLAIAERAGWKRAAWKAVLAIEDRGRSHAGRR
jgi:Protein of unknown function (DUF3631)